jgi:hypothetical protein
MRTELISIATDTLPLDGAFYLPEGEPSGAAMLFHGNTMNFYVGAPRLGTLARRARVLPPGCNRAQQWRHACGQARIRSPGDTRHGPAVRTWRGT